MTNSGAPQFPQPGQFRTDSSQTRRAGNTESSIGKLNQAPSEIRAEITARRKAIRIEGEVTRVGRDGNIRIATPRGDVDVQLPPDQPRPQIGQRVEVEIAPPPAQQQDSAPPQVTLRPAPQNTDAKPVRDSATPVQVELRGDQASPAPPPRVEITPRDPNAPPPPNRFPEEGSLVRLTPLSPQQYEQLIESRQIIVAQTVQASLIFPPTTYIQAAAQADVLQPQLQTSEQALNAKSVPLTPAALQSDAVNISPLLTSPSPLNSSGISELSPSPSAPANPPAVLTQSVSQIVTSPLMQNLLIPDGTALDAPLNVPIRSRSQAAIAQLQNAASSILPGTDTGISPQNGLAAPITQEVRVGTISPPFVALTGAGEALNNTVQFEGLNEGLNEGFKQNTILSSHNAAQLSGVVIAKTEAQVPIVQFSIPQNAGQPLTQAILNAPLNAPLSPMEQQTFMLQFPSDALLMGSRIDITPQILLNASASHNAQASAVNVAQANSLGVIPFANLAFPHPWPAFQDIQQTLLQSSAQNAAQTAQAFSNVIPSPANSTQFAPAALLFVAAMRGGDMGSWLSDKASEILRSSGKSSLMSRIGAESTTISRAADAPSGEWRGMNIPLMWDGDIQKIALHYKHDSTNDDNQKKQSGNKGTRFIFDLNLDAMGKVQLDGFFRPISDSGPRLDIVLRTEERFSASMQAEMRRVYMDAIKPSQIGGELSFQDGIDSWVMIDAQDPAALGVNA